MKEFRNKSMKLRYIILYVLALLVVAAMTTLSFVDFNVKLVAMVVMNVMAYMIVVRFHHYGLFFVLLIYGCGALSITYTTRLSNHLTNGVIAFQLATMISAIYLFVYVRKNDIAIKKLYDEAVIDEMTRLHNKRYYEYRIAEEISRANRLNSKLVLLVMDLDGFKNFNDTMGHKVGDELLQILGRHFQNNIRKNEILCRYGGDEFVLIISNYDESEKDRLLARMYQVLNEFSDEIFERLHHSITLSIGAAIYPEDAKDKDNLFKCADIAMYQSKKKSGSTLTRYNEAFVLE